MHKISYTGLWSLSEASAASWPLVTKRAFIRGPSQVARSMFACPSFVQSHDLRAWACVDPGIHAQTLSLDRREPCRDGSLSRPQDNSTEDTSAVYNVCDCLMTSRAVVTVVTLLCWEALHQCMHSIDNQEFATT